MAYLSTFWLRTEIPRRYGAVTVAAITSTVHGTAIEIPVGPANGLDHPCAVNPDHVFTIDHTALGRRVGFLLDDQERLLGSALAHAFDLDIEF